MNRTSFSFSFGLLLVAATFGVQGCRKDQETIDWQVSGSPELEVDMVDDSDTCEKCLSFTPQLRISSAQGSGLVDESHYLAVDSSQRVIVSRGTGHQVYGQNGNFLRLVGRQGRGPMEFGLAGPISVDSVGRIHFFDPAENRETIVDEEFRLVGEVPLPLGIIYDAIAIGDGSRRLLNSLLIDPSRVGFPLHWVKGDTILASFGEPSDTSYSPTSVALRRQLARHPSGHIVAARRFEYVVEAFASSGKRLVKARRLGLWRQTTGVPDAMVRGQQLFGYVQDIEVDEYGRLWVLSMEPRDDWDKYARDAVLPNGTTVLVPIENSPPWYRSRVEVVDTRTWKVLASRLLDLQLWGFLGASRIYGYEYESEGEPQLVLYEPKLSLRISKENQP